MDAHTRGSVFIVAVLLLLMSVALVPHAQAVPMTYVFDLGGPLTGSFVADPSLLINNFQTWNFSDSVGLVSDTLVATIFINSPTELDFTQFFNGTAFLLDS